MMNKAFTLIELLVVIAVLSVLIGLSFPVYSRVTENGRATACLSNLRQIGAGLNLYLGEHDTTFPTLQGARASTTDNVATIDDTLTAYIDNPKVFLCPSDYQGIGKTTGTSYYWNSALNGQTLGALNFLTISDPTRIPVLGDKEGFHPYLDNKVNILYVDGHVTKEIKFFTSP